MVSFLLCGQAFVSVFKDKPVIRGGECAQGTKSRIVKIPLSNWTMTGKIPLF